MNNALDVARSQHLRRTAAGVVLAAVPVLTNLPSATGLSYAALWSYWVTDWTSNVFVDVALYTACFFSPLNAAVCGALAIAQRTHVPTDADLNRHGLPVLSLLYQPIVFFRARLAAPPFWRLALGGPLGCAALAMVSHAIFSEKVTGPFVAAAAGSRSVITSMLYMGIINAAFVYVVVWLTASAVMIAFDVLFGAASRPLRILQSTALAFYSQVPWLVAVIVIASMFDPPSSLMPDGAVSSTAEVERFKRLLQLDPVLAALRALNHCFAVWLYALFGVGHHVATGLSLPGSLLLATTTYVMLHGLSFLL